MNDDRKTTVDPIYSLPYELSDLLRLGHEQLGRTRQARQQEDRSLCRLNEAARDASWYQLCGIAAATLEPAMVRYLPPLSLRPDDFDHETRAQEFEFHLPGLSPLRTVYFLAPDGWQPGLFKDEDGAGPWAVIRWQSSAERLPKVQVAPSLELALALAYEAERDRLAFARRERFHEGLAKLKAAAGKPEGNR